MYDGFLCTGATLSLFRLKPTVLFCLCFSTRFVFSTDHDGQRLWPIPLPAAKWRPNPVCRYHPHTMGNDACAWLGHIIGGTSCLSIHPHNKFCPNFFLGENVSCQTMKMHLNMNYYY